MPPLLPDETPEKLLLPILLPLLLPPATVAGDDRHEVWQPFVSVSLPTFVSKAMLTLASLQQNRTCRRASLQQKRGSFTSSNGLVFGNVLLTFCWVMSGDHIVIVVDHDQVCTNTALRFGPRVIRWSVTDRVHVSHRHACLHVSNTAQSPAALTSATTCPSLLRIFHTKMGNQNSHVKILYFPMSCKRKFFVSHCLQQCYNHSFL